MLAVETTELSKKYHNFQALNQVNISIKQGSIYGFIGLNGAGKTTMMRILLNMIKPSVGQAKIFGENVATVQPSFWNQIGYMIETPHAYQNLTVSQNIDLYGKMRLLSKADRDKRAVEMMNALQLTQYKDTLVRNLSLGNNQKIGLIKALIHHPKVLLLDEPTNGLDPTGLAVTRQLLIKEAAKYGTTILISSHILDEVEKMVTHIGILHHGKLLLQQSKAEFEDNSRKRLLLSLPDKDEQQKAKLILHSYQIQLDSESNKLVLPLQSDRMLNEVEALLEKNHLFPISNHVERESLEKYFLREIGE
ncbi:ABC transporter ATP-binding protein [Lactiplantibacillus plantarum]|uniref:ABC transporter ATP-binding protein n=1 Tax=Lactiplantibacillus plantarum TaxID=1590 RepID=UPI003EE7C368